MKTQILAVAVLASVVTGCSRPPESSSVESMEQKAEAPAKVSVGIVRAQLMEKTANLPAAIESDETAMLMARVEAYVAEVLVDIGDEVEAGQVLVQLSAPELRQRVAQHEAAIKTIHAAKQMTLAELKAAQSQNEVMLVDLALQSSKRDRLSRLVDTGAIESQRLEEAEATLGMANAKIEKSKNAIEMVEAKLLRGAAQLAIEQGKLGEAESLTDYLEIKAPFAGLVVKRNVDAGNLVQPGSSDGMAKPLLTIAKVDKLRAIVHATMDVAAQLTVGGEVSFIADDLPDEKFIGQLSRTSGSYDSRTRMMRAEIDFENPRDEVSGHRRLRAGSYGSATIVLVSKTLPVLPESALRRGVNSTSVVIIQNGVCVISEVKIALEQDGLVGIASGIEAGDQVVVKNPGSLEAEQMLKETQIELVTW
ncbi:MAG: efflux RND transporter periplasmic adaptor subunit [Planctomycetes bacterium]|nr:efflux RND transporter periplasmic adaptor subunit [Planctomycetota bacterium]